MKDRDNDDIRKNNTHVRERIVVAVLTFCAVVSFDISGNAQTQSGKTVTETVTTAAKSTVEHTNIRNTVNDRTDTIRSNKPLAGDTAKSASDRKSGTSKGETSGSLSESSLETGSQNIQVYPEKYDMNLTLDTKNKKLSGTVTVRLRNNTGKDLSMFCLRNYAASVLAQNGGKSSDAEISKVTDMSGDSLAISKGKDASVVYVSLGDNAVKSSETGSFVISFSEKIPKLDDRFGYHAGSDGDLQFQLTYCFPSVAMYEDGDWNENPYFYAGETACSPCTDYTAVLKVPKEYIVSSTGTSTRNGGSVRINATDVRDMAIIASNHMRCDTTDIDGKKINLYYLTDNSNSSDYRKFVVGASSDAMEMFTKSFGEYAYDELDVVESYLPGGMEYPGLVMINTNSGDKKTSYSDLCTLTAHEIGHEWFYAAVGNDQYDEAWLDEGLATFLGKGIYASSGSGTLSEAVKYDKSNKVTPVKTWSSESAYDKYAESDLKKYSDDYYIDLPYDEFKGDSDYTAHVYDGGCAFISALRDEMGSQTFNKALKDYYDTYSFKISSTDDFIDMIRSYDPTGKTQNTINKFIKQ